MTVADKAFTGSIPELYERHLVPLLFAAYARDMAQRVAEAAPQAVLETAAGTGALTRVLAASLPAPTRLVATDLNEAMLEVARGRVPVDRPVEWRQADALSLPFEDGSFDVLACQFGVMFLPDKVAAFGEARRVLAPQGRFVFSVWGEIGANEFAQTVTQALADVFPRDPPRFLARAPHGYHDADRIAADLKEAGFGRVERDVVDHVGRGASPRDVATGLCQGSPLRAEILERDESALDDATGRVAEALAARFGPGPVEGRLRALLFTAAA